MNLHFLGAAREVTGSMHMLEVNSQRILLDCGLYQGRRDETYQRNLHFPFAPADIHAVVLSHAHIDHSGNLPNLVRQGFTGNIWCTTATRNLSTYMLMDSGHIHESDAAYVNKKRRRSSDPLIEPIYTQAHAKETLKQFITVSSGRAVTVADGVEVTFMPAGHILGAAFVQVDIREHETGKRWRLVFSGDLGRSESLLLNPPVLPPADADIVLLESTYGDRLHDSSIEALRNLRKVVNATVRRRGKVIIPAFAVGRTQELVYALNTLEADGEIPHIPIYVDSPLAVEATDVFRMHPEEWNADVAAFVTEERRRNPFDAGNIDYIRDASDSKRLNHDRQPMVIISASGMAETGRILHHLKNNISDPENTVLIVSFQAQETLGRKLKDGVNPVRIFGEEYRVRAQVASIEGYSAHADQSELLAWARPFDPSRLQAFCLVHGEPDAQAALQGKLAEAGYGAVQAPARGDTLRF
jgi:metallo-beta-lactamase family protein